jgi:hypothetical protein
MASHVALMVTRHHEVTRDRLLALQAQAAMFHKTPSCCIVMGLGSLSFALLM